MTRVQQHFPSPFPALTLARGLYDRKSRLGPAPLSLPTVRGGYKDEGWDCHIHLSGRTGEEQLRVESVLPHSPAALARLPASARICRGLGPPGETGSSREEVQKN